MFHRVDIKNRKACTGNMYSVSLEPLIHNNKKITNVSPYRSEKACVDNLRRLDYTE